MKKILIDVNSIVPRRGKTHLPGIGRTTLDLLTALGKLKNELPFKIQLFFHGSNSHAIEQYNLPFSVLHFPLPASSKYINWNARLYLKEFFSNYDLYHIPHNYAATAKPNKTLLTIHDAMFFSYPESFLGHDFARENYPCLAKSCKGIITCSHSSKKDIVEYMNVPEDKVTVAHWGVSSELFFPESQINIDGLRTKFKIQSPYFTMVSCDIGRKNTISLLRAFRKYVDSRGNYDLVLVWGNPPVETTAEFADLVDSRRVHFLKHLSEDELRIVYSGASASFFPSKYEGFGLPILESMACGTPVVTCRNSSLEEVGGKMAFYTDPDDLSLMARYMHDFESGSEAVIRTQDELLDYARQFSWKKTAKEYIRFYEKYL